MESALDDIKKHLEAMREWNPLVRLLLTLKTVDEVALYLLEQASYNTVSVSIRTATPPSMGEHWHEGDFDGDRLSNTPVFPDGNLDFIPPPGMSFPVPIYNGPRKKNERHQDTDVSPTTPTED